MKKEDWLEYFQLINDRLPTAEEQIEALENGDYYVINKASQGSNSHIKQTNSEENDLGQFSVSYQRDDFKNESLNFWRWIMSSLHHPVEGANYSQPSWYGWAIIGILSLLSGLASGILVNAITRGTAGMLGVTGGNTGIGEFVWKTIFTSALFVFCILLVTIFGGWVAKRGILGNKSFTFKFAIDYYGRLYVPLLAIFILVFLSSMLKIVYLTIVLASIGGVLWSFISIFAIMNTKSEHSALDTFYAMLLALIVNFLIVFSITLLVIFPTFGEGIVRIL